MTSYVGTPGALVPIVCASRLSFTEARAMSTLTTLGGRRVAQLGAAARREWSCSMGVEASADLSRLQMLLRSVPQPWVWLDAWALSTNTLTPDQTRWRGLPMTGTAPTVGSIVELAGGGLAVSLNDPTGPTSRILQFNAPVVPGVPVTAGLYVRQSGASSVQLRLSWRDALGALISSTTVTQASPTSGPLARITVTATPPAGAVDCYLVVTNHSVVAAPSLTFTSVPTTWGVGAGCAAAVIAELEVEVVNAWASPGGQHAGYGFSVTEVG